MENRKLNKILLGVVGLSLVGILVVTILSSPNFFSKNHKEDSSEEVVAADTTDVSSASSEGASSGSENTAAQNETSQSANSQAQSAAKVNLNAATKEQLLTVPGIGETRADQILALRQKLGKFTSVSQLKRIDGIGGKTYAKLQPYFYV